MVDSATKWIEAIPVASTSSKTIIFTLRSIFSRFGFPKCLVSDNSTFFSSVEFQNFVKSSGIIHIFSPPYHPNSNGLAERAVRTIKEGMKKFNCGSFSERLLNILFAYRRAPVSSLGTSPADAFLGRSLRTRLDLLHPNYIHDRVKIDNCKKKFRHGDHVWTRSFNNKSPWIQAQFVSPIGNIMYKLRMAAGAPLFRHLDQVRPASSPDPVQTVSDTPPCSPAPSAVPDDSVSSSPAVRRSARVRKPPERLTYF